MNRIARGFAAFSLALALSACAGMLRNPDIADVKRNAGHYSDRTVTLDGTVTSSWGVPLVPFKMYKVDDGTGEITVLSRGGNRTPSKGSHVKVKGRRPRRRHVQRHAARAAPGRARPGYTEKLVRAGLELRQRS